MIISHKHKFIFIKTVKTAGTSIEIALSKFCGPDDVITPISPEDEVTRKNLGYRGPQNYYIPFSKFSKTDYADILLKQKRPAFYNHVGASYIKEHIDKEVWDTYFKFSFERNPWDKVVSWYYWKFKSEPRPTISEFVQSTQANKIKGFELYTSFSDIVVDKIFFYEKLDQAMEEIHGRLNLDDIPVLPMAKGGFRKDKRSYRDILSENDKEKIAKVYAREVSYFNYTW